MAAIDYLNFDLLFDESGEKYRARVIQAPVSEGEQVEFDAPFTLREQKKFLATLLGSVNGNGSKTSRWETGKEFGQRLFEAVFQGDVLTCYLRNLDAAKAKNIGLRVRLRLKEVPALNAMPWEYLYYTKTDRFLAISTRTPVVRYLEHSEAVSSLKVELPLKMLVAISTPSDHPPLDAEQEWVKLQEAFHKLQRKGLVHLARLEKASLTALQKKLRDGEYHIFHFIGHGEFDEKKEDGLLIFENEEGCGDPKSGAELGAVLRDSPVRLAVLNACQGGRASRRQTFAGCAPRLIQQGLPAVIAMQCPVNDANAIVFSSTFYDFLTEGYPVDGALSEARKAIFLKDPEAEWAAPVLYMHSRHGRLFDFKRKPASFYVRNEDKQLVQKASSFPPFPPKLLAKIAVALTLLLVGLSLYMGWQFSIPDHKRLLVLPLKNVGNDSTHQVFCDGLMETLTSGLTQLEQYSQRTLWVVPANEVRENKIKSASEAKKKFDVNLAVSGSVQREHNNVILTINLVDAATLLQLHAFEIRASAADISDLQDKALFKLAKILNVNLQPQAQQALTAGGTTVPGANEFYLQGRGYLLQHSQPAKSLETALRLFQRALELDSLYALAYAGLGEIFWKKHELTSEAQWIVQAEQNCRHALELDKLVAPAYVTLAKIYNGTGRYEQAHKQVELALELNPLNTDALRMQAFVYEKLDKLKEAERIYKQAIALHPDYWEGYNQLGNFYFEHGRYDEATKQFQQVVALTPDNTKGYNNLGALYSYLERNEEARATFMRSLTIASSYEAYNNLAALDFNEAKYADAAKRYVQALAIDSTDYRVWGHLASACYWMPNAKAPAQQYYRVAARLARNKKTINRRDAVVLAHLAEYYVQLGESEKAREHIAGALDHGPNNVDVLAAASLVYEALGKRALALHWLEEAMKNGYAIAEIEHEPGFRGLRREQRFQEILSSSQ